MYFSPGLNPNEIGDFDVVEHEGKLHVFYLAIPSHGTFSNMKVQPLRPPATNWDR